MFSIEAKIFPLIGVSGHLYLEVFDEAGKRLLQVNGFATDKVTGKIKTFGRPFGDKLLVVADGHTVLAGTLGATRDNHPHKGCVLFSGNRDDIDKALAALGQKAREINTKNPAYEILTQNSNTVFMHMVAGLADVLPIDLVMLGAFIHSKPYLPGIKGDFKKTVSVSVQKPLHNLPKKWFRR